MTPDQIKSLSREQLTETYSSYVGKIVSKLLRTLSIRVEREDLIAYGMIGLFEAQDRFEPDGNTEFSTFAYYRIRGAILDGCRTEGWLTRERSKKSAKQTRALDTYLEDVSQERAATGPAKSFSDAVNRVNEIVTTSATIILMVDQELTDLVGSQEATQHEKVEKKETTTLLRMAMKELSDEERDIVVRHDFNNERMDEIGKSYGYSKAWVSRVRTRALSRMRAFIASRE